MSCHTWCYAHLPEKAEEWKKEAKEAVGNFLEFSRQFYNDLPDKTIRTYIKADIAANLSCIDNYYKKDNDLKKKFCKEIGYSRKRYEELLASLLVNEDDYTVESYRKRHLDENQALMESFQMLDIIDFLRDILNPVNITLSYGLYIIRDRKIYRDTLRKNCGFDKSYHDIFRLYDYDAKPCNSLEETLDRCKEYKIDWNEPENDLDLLKEYWKNYPDSIIEFG